MHLEKLLEAQVNEITEYLVYKNLASREADPEKKHLLNSIASQEKSHYEILSKITGKRPKPKKSKVIFYTIVSIVFGYQFALKHMERGEESAQEVYKSLSQNHPELEKIVAEEHEHELMLIELINEERLEYVSSMILGLNDGIVELLGTVAGLTLALKESRLVAVTSLIMGIAACLSMSASEYLSTSAEKEKNPFTAAFYTAVSYFSAVVAIVLPYFLMSNPISAFFSSLALVFLLVSSFNYYIAVVKKERFGRRLFQMLGIVVSVSLVSFLVGYLARKIFGVSV